jgi:TRAP-type mannitol/chloroaromatic compound transport system substrate-binding protein
MMTLKKWLSPVVAATLALGVMTVGAPEADAQDQRVRWKMHSSFPSSLAILGSGGKRLSEIVSEMSGGGFDMRFHEPGSLVPGLQYFDPVSQGSIDAAWGAAGYNVNKEPALAFFTAVPFGPGVGEYLAWLRFGGGHDLWMEIYNGFGVHGLMCGMLAPESSGWFRTEIKSTDDLRGLKMRFFGLGARVMEKFGVSTQLLAGGDIYPALELGTIDATEFSMPALDESLGFYQVAKHYYFPGWHQQSTLLDLMVNKEKYDGLSPTNKAILDKACGDNLSYTHAEGEAIQFGAMARMTAKGVTIHRWPDETLAKFKAAWEEVIVEDSAKNPVFKRVYESYAKFRADYAIWKEHGFLK